MSGNFSSTPAESASERITRTLGRFLSRWGVDALQYHWLLQASLKMDFRSTNPLASGQVSETKSALRNTVLLNLLFSGLMSLLFAARADTFFFAVIMMGYAMAMLAMMILMEFGLAVISPDDHLILAHRPISSRTFLTVRFSNLLFYVLLLGLSLSIIPAFAGWMCAHSRWFFPVVYLVVSMVAAFFVAGAVVVFYGLLMRWFNYERFKDVLVYCQIVLSFGFFFGYQLVPRLAGDFKGMDIERLTHGWSVLFPSVWFAGLSELALGYWRKEALITGATGVLLACVALPCLLKAISLDCSESIGRVITATAKSNARRSGTKRARNVLSRGWKLFFKDVEERAFFSFVVTMFRRNRHLKLQLYPNFGVMVAMFVLAVIDQKGLADPFSGQGSPGIFVSFTAMAFVFGAVGVVNVLPYSDEYAGGWLFHVTPIRRVETILKAIKKATFLFLFFPLLLLEGILFSFFWPPLHAFELGLCGLLIGSLLFQIALFQFRGFPFTRKPEKGTQSRQFVIVIMLSSVFGVMVLLPFLLSKSQLMVGAACAVMLFANVILSARNNRSFARHQMPAESS